MIGERINQHRVVQPTKSLKMNVHRKQVPFPRWFILLFAIFCIYLVVPFVAVPFLGLSLSAPIFFLLTLHILTKRGISFRGTYGLLAWLAGLTWLGITISAIANGLLSAGVNFNRQGAVMIVRYAYWITVMVITAYIASQPGMLKRIVRWLGWGVVILALLRWVEVLVFANIGAWMGTRFTSQNNYGLLFSAYSPFLLIRAVDQRGTKRFLSLLGYLMLLGAVAINGSRGSWVAVSVGLALMLLLLALTQRKRLVGVLLLLSLLIAIGGVIFSSVPALYEPVMQRFDTMDSLETDKSYQIRGLMNQKSLSLFYDSPVFGVGVTRFRQVSVPLEIPRLLRYAPQEHFDAKTPHNSFLSFLAENGLMGALPLGSLLIFLGLRGGVTTLKGIMHHQYFLAAVFLAFVQMSMHMWAINNFGNTAPWFIYGLMGAVIIGNGSKHPK